MLLRDNIYRTIRRAILTCEFQPGQELREQVLADRYRVSRSPVRDSLLRLEQENLVMVLPRQGYRVKPVSMRSAEDLLGLRLLIEPACAAAAARQADDTGLQALGRLRSDRISERIAIDFTEHNRSFHRAVADLSGNARMAAIALDLREQFDRLVRVSLLGTRYGEIPEAHAEHDAIIDAIQAHDADLAGRLAYQHVARAHACVVAALQGIAEACNKSAESPTTTRE